MKKNLYVYGLVTVLCSAAVFAADPASFKAHRVDSQANSDGPDYVQHQAAGPGWFSNLGPTGIRAMLTDTEGKTEWQGQGIQYLVKYVFDGSPADGLVFPGDIIIGVNGSQFQKVYIFGYWYGFGYEGPLTEFGEAVEESERDLGGILTLMVERDGQPIEVEIQIDSKGAFSETYPYNCPKSATLRAEAVEKLIDLQKDNGLWPGYEHGGFMACIALLAQGEQGSHMTAVQKYLDRRSQASINDSSWNWGLAFNAIAMSEYQMLTGDERYRDYMLLINEQLARNNNRYNNHTYGHVGLAEGSAGYGPMKGTTSLVLLAWAVMEKAGIAINTEAMHKTLIEMDMAGCAGYGWPDQGSEVVDAIDINTVLSTLTELNGNINDTNTQYRTAGFPYGNVALLHTLRPWQNYSPQIVTNNVNKIAFCRNVMVTGHGSGMLHGWSTFLALCMSSNRGVTEPLRINLDYNKALLNSARCYDGSFYTQPQRDDFGGDLFKGSRTTATALWLTILSAPDKNLSLLGSGEPGAPTVFAGEDTMTWSGKAVTLSPVIVEQADSGWTDLTYLWTADPADGVVFTPDDGDPTRSSVETPIVKITKETEDPSVVSLTLAVNDQGRQGEPVEDAMSIYIYDDACKMVRIGQGKGADNPTDLDGNCITNLADLAILASEWLSGEALPSAIWK